MRGKRKEKMKEEKEEYNNGDSLKLVFNQFAPVNKLLLLKLMNSSQIGKKNKSNLPFSVSPPLLSVCHWKLRSFLLNCSTSTLM